MSQFNNLEKESVIGQTLREVCESNSSSPLSLSRLIELGQSIEKLSSSPENELLTMLNEHEQKSQSVLVDIRSAVLAKNMSYFGPVRGPDIFERLLPFYQWKKTIGKARLWSFEKTSLTAPRRRCEGIDYSQFPIKGVNFASQDYLSLSSHPEVKQAAIAAIEEYGVHSAGSPAVLGCTKYSLQLEKIIADFIKMNSITLFPTGWGAGYGVLTGLIRHKDHIVMDQLSHSCLREGARAATQNVYLCPHLDNAAMEKKIQEIRNNDPYNGILVVTETLFSMDSDSPDLEELQGICRKYGAFLLVDIAHDLGCLGKNGRGILESQNMLGKVDLVIGSFSKTFASNGGFIGTHSQAVKEYLSFFSGPRIFSNALSPVQSAAVIKAFEIVSSTEGAKLRARLMDNILYLRNKFSELGLILKGAPSAIVPFVIGEEGLARIVGRILIESGVITNVIEFPAVAKHEARIRIQVMAEHTEEDIDILAQGVRDALHKARSLRSMINTL